MATVNSARSNYRDVMTVPNSSGTLMALDQIEVYVAKPGLDPLVAGNRVNVYGSRNPSDLTPLPQPIVTTSSGIVNFWAEPGEYDIFTHDRVAPARIGDQTFGWSALSPIAKGIPSSLIRDDQALDINASGASLLRQVIPIGAVIDWWRPSSSFPIPDGFAVCNGQVIAADQHDFGGGATVQLPDLRNKFIVGADNLKVDGGQSAPGDGTAAFDAQHPHAPGIRGTGGANAPKDLRHSHQFGHSHTTPMLDHYHGVTGVDHLHGVTVSISTGASNSNTAGGVGSGGYAACAYYNHSHTGSGSGGTGAADRSLYTNTGYSTAGAGASSTVSQSTTTTDLGTASTTADMRPSHYGLLKIMKVRRS